MEKAFSKAGVNECPFCHTNSLSVWEFEVTGFTLDEYGRKHELLTLDDLGYSVHLTCMKCGKSFPADKKGNSWFVKRNNPLMYEKELPSNPFQK